MSKLVTVDVNLDALIRLSKFMEKAGTRIEQAMAATVQTNRAMMFISNGAYNGHPGWKKPVFRDGQPLQDKGALRNSIAPRVRNGSIVPTTPGKGGYINYSGTTEEPEVAVGTQLHYAKIHTTGGKITAKNGKALKIPIPSGKAAKITKKRIENLETELENEKGVKRAASLQKRAESTLELYLESKNNGSKRKRKAYLAKLSKKIANLSGRDRKAVIKIANRVTSTTGNFIFRKSVTIPKRDYTAWNDRDQAEVEETLTALIQEILEEQVNGG